MRIRGGSKKEALLVQQRPLKLVATALPPPIKFIFSVMFEKSKDWRTLRYVRLYNRASPSVLCGRAKEKEKH